MKLARSIVDHYSVGDLLQRIEAALLASGKDPAHPTIDDLAAVDEFHSRGRQAHGRARRLAAGFGADRGPRHRQRPGRPGALSRGDAGLRVVGVDLTPEYAEVANELTRRCGLADRARFLTANALDLPFDDASFAAAYTQHVAMNIADKAKLYAEAARVLQPGATFVIYDILRGPGGPVQYPTPWSADGSTSFLVDLAELQGLLADAGFTIDQHSDRRQDTVSWFEQRAAAAAAGTPPPLSIGVLLGPLFVPAFANLVANLRSGALAPTMLRAIRR